MKPPFNSAALFIVATIAGSLALGCKASEGPNVGSQTNWQKRCEFSEECGYLECICGTCTLECDADATCSELSGASCVAPEDSGAIAQCDGQKPVVSGMCLASCPSEGCGEGNDCVAGVCSPQLIASSAVTIDTSVRHQTLDGFGASLAYAEDDIISHPMKASLFDAMFVDSGLDIVRLRNRYEKGSEDELKAGEEILQAATSRMEKEPITLMTSGSPPAALKANGERLCEGNPDTCTLKSLENGEFDYAGFAEHWAASLRAYAETGLTPDYISIQNNPNWIPPESSPNEACKFLPSEGTETVEVDGSDIEVSYPGFTEALSAVSEALSLEGFTSKITAPEVSSPQLVADYLPDLDSSTVDALAYHMYSLDPSGIDKDALESLSALSEDFGRPLFQTEMRATGFDTAVMIHSALTIAGATMYLQNDFISPGGNEEDDELALISVEDSDFSLEDPFHTFQHFALHTDPGWQRVSANSEKAEVLTSAYLSPDGAALTIVLVNDGDANQTIQLNVSDEGLARFSSSQVYRTTFDGIERFVDLGRLSSTAVLRVPTSAIVTVALFNK